MSMPLVLIVVSIITALFSDSIDRKFNTNGQLRKVLLVFSAGVFCISAIALAIRFFA